MTLTNHSPTLPQLHLNTNNWPDSVSIMTNRHQHKQWRYFLGVLEVILLNSTLITLYYSTTIIIYCQHLLVLNNVSPSVGTLSWHWYTVAAGEIRNPHTTSSPQAQHSTQPHDHQCTFNSEKFSALLIWTSDDDRHDTRLLERVCISVNAVTSHVVGNIVCNMHIHESLQLRHKITQHSGHETVTVVRWQHQTWHLQLTTSQTDSLITNEYKHENS